MREEFIEWQKAQGGNVHWFSNDQKFADAQTQYNWRVFQAGALAMRERAANAIEGQGALGQHRTNLADLVRALPVGE